MMEETLLYEQLDENLYRARHPNPDKPSPVHTTHDSCELFELTIDR